MVLSGPGKLWLLMWALTYLHSIGPAMSGSRVQPRPPPRANHPAAKPGKSSFHWHNPKPPPKEHGPAMSGSMPQPRPPPKPNHPAAKPGKSSFHSHNPKAPPKGRGAFRPGSAKPKPSPMPQFTNHNGQVCSTWGDYNIKTFDGDLYYFPGKCKYVFASHCKSNQEDFNIVFQRTENNGVPSISHVSLKIHEVMIEISNKSIVVDGELVTDTPMDKSRVLIDQIGNYLKISYPSDILFMWNGEDSILLKLNRDKYGNQTCGLCGDFNGVNGLTFDGIEVTGVQLGNLQKHNGPVEDCPDISPPVTTSCKDVNDQCKKILTSGAFSSCTTLVDPTVYINICVQDLCRCSSKNQMSCLCNTLAEYSRQCTHAGGVPGDWRTSTLCPKTCSLNMIHKECGSPCLNTCSNTERSLVCEDHGIDGCFCPKDTVLDDINHTGCIPQGNCFCVYDGKNYSPGSSYSTPCRACTCSKGKWKCKELPCKGSCSVQGGSHITTFDGSRYSTNGDCSYVLAKHSTGHDFALLGELRRCGVSHRKSCLKGVVLVLNKGEITVSVKENCVAFLNWMAIQPPVSVANVRICQPSSFFLNIRTTFGLSVMIQCVPVMQVYVDLDRSYENQTCGLCGNFNNIQADDFKALSGVIEGTAAAFVNTWKTLATCPNIKNTYDDPCSLNVEKEKYAQHWCALLTSATGPFSSCHSLESPLIYHANCLSDTCSGADSEQCMCAALSSYAFACARKGVLLSGWRDNVCQKFTQTCKESQVYRSNISQLQPTCRSLSEREATEDTELVPVDGCVCSDGTYMNDNGDCVEASACPCYYQSNVLQSGEMIEENGVACTCEKGQLNCIGSLIKIPNCIPPLIYLNCTNEPKGTKGVECQKSCDTLDMDCYTSQCNSGCVCPKGLVSDGKRGCIPEEQCPCIHNEASYSPGTSIAVACNTCTCKNRKWQCTLKQCQGSCSIYGDGHYTTFDNKHFTFDGGCEYTLAQDNCGDNGGQSSFRVLMQNVQCGSNGTMCSKTIKVYFGEEELLLDNEKLDIVKKADKDVKYEVLSRGMFLLLQKPEIVIMWDKKTSIMIKINYELKSKVCGICGNYDGNANNDFTTRSRSVVQNHMEFCNSWKTDPSCPNVHEIKNPCSIHKHRKAWAIKQCSIITSNVFQSCHSQVDPTKYYDSCISDSCACDSGGDCECFCSAVAAYAQACSENGVCIRWRTPTICPIFCDYYNEAGECAWHYKPCGNKCMKTCKNPTGECLHELSGLEGCYPNCPPSKPYLNEDIMKCVSQCGCEDTNGNFYNYGENVPAKENCYSCECSMKGISCQYDPTACYCEHEGNRYKYLEIISADTHDDDNDGECKQTKCDINGTIVTFSNLCTTLPTNLPHDHTTTFMTSTTSLTTTSELTSEMTSHTETTSKFTTETEHVPSVTQPPPFVNPPHSTSKMSTTSFSPTSTISSTATSTIQPTLSTTTIYSSSSQPNIPSTPSTTASESTSPTSTSEPSTTTSCSYCVWTEWYNMNHPTSDLQSGDEESIEIITSKGYSICSEGFLVKDIQCQAVSYPGVKFSELGQHATCTVKSGLKCSNYDNPKSMHMCPDFEIRYSCCEIRDCSTTSPSSVTSPEPTSPTTSPMESTTHEKLSTITTHSQPVSSTTTLSVSSSPPLPTTSKGPESSTSTSKTFLSPTTKMLPTSTTISQSTSSTTSIFASTTQPNISSTPSTIASESPSLTSTSEPSTTTSCSYCVWTEWYNMNHPTSDLQSGDEESIEIITSKGYSICNKGYFVKDIQCQAVSYPGVKFSDLGQHATCTVKSGLKCSNYDNPKSMHMCPDFEIRYSCCEIRDCSTTSPSSVTSPEPTSPTTSPMESTTHEKSSTTQPNIPSTPSTTALESTSPTSTSEPSTTTKCLYCVWTKWYNENHPTSNVHSGDHESYEIMKSKGYSVCSANSYVSDIECESSSYPGMSFTELGQNATCTVKTGLSCENINNVGQFIMCLDYKIRLLCCENRCSSSMSTSSVTTVPSTLSTLTSTPTSGRSSTIGWGLCLHEGTIYEAGSSIPQSPGSCQKCKCTLRKHSAKIECKPLVCNKDCQMGYKYKEVHGQCCGTCVQEFCYLNNTVPIKPGDIWHPPGDNCTSYGCEPDTLMVVKSVISCPQQKPIDCEKGILVNFTSIDGCCTIQFCEPRKCDVMKSWKLIESGGCKANVTLTNCGGYCSSVSRYPNFPKMQQHDCTCCQATKTETKNIQLECNNGRKIGYTLTDILKCSCRSAACVFTE